MASVLEKNVLNKIGDTIETIFGKTNQPTQPTTNGNGGGQTCLERFGIEARSEHLFRNGWRKDIQYTKALVDSEYSIQSEFMVSSYQDDLIEHNQEKVINNAKKERDKLNRQIDIMESQVKPKERL